MKRKKKVNAVRKIGFEQLRETSDKFLIVCEGEKTEPKYFHSIRREKGLSEKTIFIRGLGYTPKKLVEHAKELKEKNDHQKEPFDQVWCVFDRDDHVYLNEAIQQAKANGFKVAFSNPSFELWYLLHFTDQTASITRQQAKRDLKAINRIPKYVKSMDVYPIILSSQKEAINRAKQLRLMHRKNRNDSTANPSTSVDQLVTKLNTIKKR